MRWTPRPTALLAAALLTATLAPPFPAVASAQAAANPASGPAAPGRAGPGPVAVTLVTGDRVFVRSDGRGRQVVQTVAAPGREHVGFLRRAVRDAAGQERVTVLPADAAPLVAAGVLDRRLFDVSELIRQQRDDRSRATLPLLVTYRPGARPARAATVAGTAVSRALPSIGGAALNPDKAALGHFWAALTAPTPRGLALEPAIAKVWLDGRSRLLDEESNAQVGAPAAWQAGYTGKGVTVAVLDGGYDATHPDLAGVVTEARDFTGSPDGARDTLGHGTHVASTVAGSGAASGGRHRGVAPDAKLLVGKVCATQTCDDSAILAGMEWAAARARIVSMSLGGAATDGTDPLSTAVDTLSARHGTLFVVAAGNTGRPQSVGTPAAADAALAVGSVSKADRLSRFSSRGPRVGDYALKPDLVAPGQAILGARAAGTSMGRPVDASYTSADGTSMATPHVSGAAALLAQQHPDWTAPQLKAALTSSAAPVAGAGVDEVGSGRLDLARLVRQPVTASPGGLGFGLLRVPLAGQPAVTKTVTYANDGDTPLTLALRLDVAGPDGPLPAGVLTLGAEQVEVPARGTATVDVTLDPARLAPGTAGSVGGRLTASAAGGVSVQTALGATAELEAYDVTVKLVDRVGRPAAGTVPQHVNLVRLDSSDGPDTPDPVGGVLTVRAPAGTYGLNALVRTPKEGEPAAVASATWASLPKFTVDRPGLVLTVDARHGQRVAVAVDRRDARPALTDLDTIYRADGDRFRVSEGYRARGPEELYAVPATADPSYFTFGVSQVLLTPPGRGAAAYYVAGAEPGRIPAVPGYRVRDRELGREDFRYRAQGKAALGSRSSVPFYLPGQTTAFAGFTDVPLPGRRAEFYTAGAVTWTQDLFQRPVDPPTAPNLDGAVTAPRQTYRPGERRPPQDWNSAVIGTDISDHGQFNEVARYGDRVNAQYWPYAPGEAGHSAWALFGSAYIQARTTLSAADGTVLGRTSAPYGSFPVPAAAGRYTLDVESSRAPAWSTLAPRVRTRWSFGSQRPADPAVRTYLPLWTLRATGPFDDLNRARAGSVLPLAVTVRPQAGTTAAAEVTRVSVEVSTDDGTSWRPAPVLGHRGDTWCAVVVNPRAGDFVSLRVSAADAAGNAVEQTTIRAYGLTR